MHLYTRLLLVTFLLGLYVEVNNGEFSCFRKFRKDKQICRGLMTKKRINTPEKCCSVTGHGFTIQALDVLGRNRYSCTSCNEWERQKNEHRPPVTTEPTRTEFVCFRKFRVKKQQCGGPFLQSGVTSPRTCCTGIGFGFSNRGQNKLGKNRYTCTSCKDWIKQNGKPTSPTPPITTTDSQVPAAWGHWGACSTTCGTGLQSRHRQCSNCDRNHHKNKQTQPCMVNHYCPIDGNWGTWLQWQACTTSCDGGTRRRERRCDFPPPMYGGHVCDGEDVDHESCNEQPCPVDGQWAEWSRFGRCSETCGMGSMTRTRECSSPSNGGGVCLGSRTEGRRCERRKCPLHGGWSTWDEWSECPVTCGTGPRTRSRKCNRPRPLFGGRPCEGSEKETGVCDSGTLCPVHGGWSEWTSYGRCRGDPCQTGRRLRSRVCNNPRPEHRGLMCRGRTVEAKSCFNNRGCLVDGGWCEFSDWSHCRSTCSDTSSIQTRHRECNCPPPQNGGQSCTGERVEVQECRGNNPCDAITVDN